MTPFPRLLAGITVGVSISESDDAPMRGFPPSEMDHVIRRIVFALLGQGAGVLFGHDWRKQGVMETVHGFARQMQSTDWPVQDPVPLLYNLLPWPDQPELDENERQHLASTLVLQTEGLPRDLEEYANAALQDRSSPLYRYFRARGLTHLRRKLTERTAARICLGGPRSSYAGRYPGIVEEALIAVQYRQPLYVSGLLGGAAQQVIDAILQVAMPDGFCSITPLAELYQHPPGPLETDPNTLADRQLDRGAVWQSFSRLGIDGLAESNGLSNEENTELFSTPSLDRVIQLVLSGLGRVTKRNN